MQVLRLPLPALECVIEHMVMAVGVYKAVRLRHVCKIFDAEVRRAVFTANIFNFDKKSHPRRLTPEHAEQWLMGEIARPASGGQNAVSSAINAVTKLLVPGSPISSYEERRFACVRSLCHVIVHNFAGDFSRLLKVMSRMGNGSSITPDDLLSAAAAVGDVQYVRHLLTHESNDWSHSEIFGTIPVIAARNGDRQMLGSILKRSSHTYDQGDSVSDAFVAACQAGKQSIVKYLISLPPLDWGFVAQDYHEGIVAAAGSGHVGILRLLSSRLCTTNREVVLSRALRQASASGRAIVVEYLLDSGADVNSWSTAGGALHMAARLGFIKVVRILLERGADPNLDARDAGQPLFSAARNEHTEVVQVLLDHGASINARLELQATRHTSAYSYSVLARAARNGELKMVRFLLEKGVDPMVDGDGDRALQQAAAWGHEDIVRLLVELGVDINGRGGKEEPPIIYAMMYAQQHVVELLLELGAEEKDPDETRYGDEFHNGFYPQPRRFL
ncbi:MAG: hypothetical protein Q9169_005158 [Polycauliona sp. 2 TL-2023]